VKIERTELNLTDKLTWRNNGTWAVITLGLAVVGYWLVTWLFAASRAPAAGLDAMASSTTLSVKGMVVGIVIVAIGVIMRRVFMPRKQSA
jgi:hypothetical protein